MRLFRYLVAILGILHYVETKAFQTGNSKGVYDHMYENLYLKKAVKKSDGQNYEMRYVPHVDGKPIFIPFGELETFTPPNVLKTRPTKLMNSHSKPYQKLPKPDNHKVEVPIKVAGYTKTKENVEKDVTKVNKKYPEIKNESYDNKNIQETYEKSPGKVQKEISSSKVDLENVSKYNKKEYISNNYEKPMKKEVLDSPVVIESIKKDYESPILVKPHTEVKKYSKSSVKDNGLEAYKVEGISYADSKISDRIKESGYKSDKHKQKQSLNNDYELPVIVENFEKETTEDYDAPIVIRPFSEKHSASVVHKTKVAKHKPVLKEQKKPVIKEPVKNFDLPVVVENFEKEATNDHESPIIIRPSISEKYSVGTVDKTEILQNKPVLKDHDKIKPVLHTDKNVVKTDNKIHKEPRNSADGFTEEISDYSFDPLDEDYFGEEYDQDYDNPVVVEALVKKDEEIQDQDTENSDYDSPVVVEALVKKTEGEENCDKPIISAALIKKLPVEQKFAHSSKDYAVTKGSETNYETPIVVEALVKKTDEYAENDDKPIISAALIKKHPVEQPKYSNKHVAEEVSENYNYETPVVVEALVKKSPHQHNKKRIKYSTKMKPSKSSTHSLYEVSTPKTKQSSENVDSFNSVDKSTNPNDIKGPIMSNSDSIQSLSNEEAFGFDTLGDANDQFDGSGIINERSNVLDDSRSLFSKSNSWLASFHSQERNKFKKCTTPNDEPGNCMPIQMCPNPNLQLTLDDLLKKVCAIDEVFIGICCPEFPAETLKVDWENFANDTSIETLDTKPEGCGKIQEFGKDPQSWPWMAPLISVSTRRIFCGGILIKEQYVLTAAHCTRKIPRNQIVVVLGPSEKDATSQEFEVVEIKRHAQYNPKTMQNDLALLKLARKARRPFICLPQDEETFVGKEALILGWQGSFAASKSEEKLLVISSKECRKGAIKVVVGDNIMCTEPRTEDVMCNVDSGAPLVIKSDEKYQVIGVLTWNRNDCDPTIPSIFTRISHFKGWIENHAT